MRHFRTDDDTEPVIFPEHLKGPPMTHIPFWGRVATHAALADVAEMKDVWQRAVLFLEGSCAARYVGVETG